MLQVSVYNEFVRVTKFNSIPSSTCPDLKSLGFCFVEQFRYSAYGENYA